MLKREIGLILGLFIVIYSPWSEGRTCGEIFEFSDSQKRLAHFLVDTGFSRLTKIGSKMGEHAFVREMSRGASNYIELSIPGLSLVSFKSSLGIKSSKISYDPVIELTGINYRRGELLQGNKDPMDIAIYRMILAAQGYQKLNPKNERVVLVIPNPKNDKSYARYRNLGFVHGGAQHLYLRLSSQDLIAANQIAKTMKEL